MELSGIIEAVLFVTGEPLSLEKIINITDQSKDKCMDALKTLQAKLEGHGIGLIELNGKYQLVTNGETAEFIEKMQKEEISGQLTKSALETLAIIAYKGPLSRSQIDFVRGVNSSYIVRNLLIRGIIDRIENPRDARTYLYQVSVDFLKYFGFSGMQDLPEFSVLSKEEINVASESEDKPNISAPHLGGTKLMEDNNNGN